MPYKFKQGDPVFYHATGEDLKFRGHYTVQMPKSKGESYRIVDANNELTDADEDMLSHVMYAVFTRVPEGWPIIVPVWDEPLYNSYLHSDMYKFVCESTIAGCADEQVNILRALEAAG